MKITVCQLGDTGEEFLASWDLLVDHAQKHRPDLILLPEMPFYPWFCKNKPFDPAVSSEAVRAHVKSTSTSQTEPSTLIPAMFLIDL